MKAQANEKWTKRLLRKASIEAALADFDKKLGDAAQMFQVRQMILLSVLLTKKNVQDGYAYRH